MFGGKETGFALVHVTSDQAPEETMTTGKERSEVQQIIAECTLQDMEIQCQR